MSQRTETTLLNGRPLRYRVRKSRRARKLGIRICPREGVVVTLPWRVAYAEVPALLEEFGDWLDPRVDELGVRLGPVRKHYATGSGILVFGVDRTLRIGPLAAGRIRPVMTLRDGTLDLALPPGDILDPRPALETYLRRLARQDLPGRVARWADLIGHEPSRVIIGERISRWGSCSSRGTISLCYRLVMATPAVIDAVVAHEVCHLVHLNHSPRFYALLDVACPWHREGMAWLKDNHDRLQL
ncbi:MAG: SprT family zinc-dependent metalloprotease [bacterium]|nr:M48 family metallopeptidase [bacterium]